MTDWALVLAQHWHSPLALPHSSFWYSLAQHEGAPLRTLITYFPFFDPMKFFGERGRWPAKWVTHPAADGSGAVVQAFRLPFTLDRDQALRIHLTADERYELYLDGQRIGRGSERGDRLNWYFETHDLTLAAGKHTLVVRSWWLGDFGPARFAQISGRPGFVLAAEKVDPKLLNTGFAPWQCKLLTGYQHVPPGMTWGTGSKVHIAGKSFPWGYETGDGDNWSEPRALDWAYDSNQTIDQPTAPILRPAALPEMVERAIQVGKARHVQTLMEIPKGEIAVHAADHLAAEAAAWDALLAGKGNVTVPPRTVRRVIVDLENYYCAYTDLVTSGGAGSTVRSWWAESLFLPKTDGPMGFRVKGNRDEIEGKTFVGIGDTFQPDGGPNRLFNTLWWEAGRYLELVVATVDEPLTIERFSLRETHYPHRWSSTFDASDPRLADVTPIARRVLEMCSHETYMDCPYYEQLMYVGDTRLEVLTTYAAAPDDRLPRKALRVYDDSRKSPGFTQSRYPCRIQQTIPPFSAWWVAMVHDHFLWRQDPGGDFVRSLLPGTRAVLDSFLRFRTKDHLIAGPTGWNFMDWVPGWRHGMPPDGDQGGLSSPLNFQLAWVLRQAAELEDALGEPEFAALHRRHATEIATAATQAFWHEGRGLFSDDLKHEHFSEHAQCLALLGGSVDPDRRPRVVDHLFTDADLARTTVYFSHYLFETCALSGRIDGLFDRLQLWLDLKGLGFKTTLEMPEPSRSDCHAWGAHPLYHYFATILGIRPAAAGFAAVTIRPQLGPLEWARGKMVHPKGFIEVDVRRSNGNLSGTLKLPPGIAGRLLVNGKELPVVNSTLSF